MKLESSVHLFAAALGLSLLFTSYAGAREREPAALNLHVPSPDWRDQVIYFLMIDRFNDGNAANNDQGAGEFDPARKSKFSGGDLAGVTQRLDYIRGLGATAVWVTPPVANQWWNTRADYGGYHGYWAENFKRVDAHFGTLQDYRLLSSALHDAGMYLVQDVVVNHTADYFSYTGKWDASAPTQGFQRVADSTGRHAPTQPPFDLNDATTPAHRQAEIYHWTPAITDYNDDRQLLDFQLADLDDLDTDNPVVRRALRESYGHWIREVGVDGFRVDTAFYVEPEYFTDFLHADDKQFPGIARVAAATGRQDFHVFGEGFATDRAYEDSQARRIERYARGTNGEPLLPAMINFPLHGTALDVFAKGRPPAELAARIDSMMKVHASPHLMPTFLDNHDVDRFLAGGTEAGLKQGLLLLMTLPGIPTIYYGTEQGYTAPRAAMFAEGFGSGDRDRFDTAAPLYRYLQRATGLRRSHRLFSRGIPTTLTANAATPGALAYRMDHEGASALVVFNTSDSPALLDNLETGLAPGTVLQGIFGIESTPGDAVVRAEGRLNMTLPARGGLVWVVSARGQPAASPSASLAFTGPEQSRVQGDFEVQGVAQGIDRLMLVVDGDLGTAKPVVVAPDGRWRARVDTRSMVDASVTHRVVAWSDEAGIASPAQRFTVSPEWRKLAELADPTDDDRGPNGAYDYPTDSSWSEQRPLDIRNVTFSGAGGALKVQLRMRVLESQWNPANGFDHAVFTLFVEVPGKAGGASAMPLQNAELPDGMKWHYRLRAHGWSNALFSSTGADADREGTSVSPTSTIETDLAAGTITFTLPAAALGNLDTLSGVRVYLNAWDYDGGYRKLAPEAGPMHFGGGNGATDPLVMDDTAVIALP